MDEANDGTEKGKGRRLRRDILYGVVGAGLLGAIFAARPIAAAVQGGAGHGFGRWGHRHAKPEAMHEHIQVGVKWALREVDATDDQQKRVGEIVSGALDDLHGLRDQHRRNREAFAAQLGAPSVSREELEALRKAEMALADDASRRLVQALGDVAEVLTPEQRQALLEHAERFHR